MDEQVTELIELTDQTTAPAGIVKVTITSGLQYGVHCDGQFYFFSTVEIMKAATKKWGPKSRRVKAIYELLAEMIHGKDIEK